jgi:flagellar hook-associated protein 1 FlgK
MGLSVGLDTAVKALRSHQLAVDVASHNIANAQSPGFSRQRVLLRPVGIDGSDHFSRDALLGKAGFGVNAKDVNRIRDIFLDFQARQSMAAKSQYGSTSAALSQAELVFNDPTDDGMSKLLAKFWAAWQDVVNDPESAAARTTIVHTTQTLTTRLQRARSELSVQRDDLNNQVNAIAGRINAAASELAAVNFQIKQVELSGDMANDLRDRRDVLLDQLSAIGQISYAEQGDKTVSVYLGSHELVSGNTVRSVQSVVDQNNPGMNKLVFAVDGADVTTTTGELRGILDARDRDLPALVGKLDTLAAGLIGSVNTLHMSGYGIDNPPSTGLLFFTGKDASDIALNQALAANPRAIAAASGPNLPGDGSNALAIANLQLAPNMAAGFAATSLVPGEQIAPGLLAGTLAGAGSIASISGGYTGGQAGSWAITDDGLGNLSAVFTPLGGVAQPPVGPVAVATGGTELTLVPGLTLQIGPAFVAATQTITIAPAGSPIVATGLTIGPALTPGPYFITANGPAGLDLRFGSPTGPVVGSAALSPLATGAGVISFMSGLNTVATINVNNPNATPYSAAQQQSDLTAAGNNTFQVEKSPEPYYADIVSVLGADVAGAKGLADSSELMMGHLEGLRQSVSGVNLDEEMVNLNASQHAYNAAARVITTIDDMLDTLINRTGVTR